ncbi:helix-turn-helix domain-containing protein [Paenibacillus algicola]|nr:helix-turn-helix transcriptional regulator [Paenibacillus algicola]
MGINQRTYSDYERGILDFPTALLIQLANYYDTNIDYMLGRTDSSIDSS